MTFGGIAAAAVLSGTALLTAQVPDNKTLSGKYFFRELLLSADASQSGSAFGSLSFDGNGKFTFDAQKVTGNSGPLAASGTGTYIVISSGKFTLSSDPLRPGSPLNGRIGTSALVASNTESSNAPYNVLIALPAAAGSMSNAALSGAYQVATLEIPNGSLSAARQAFFQVNANGAGGLGDVIVSGEIAGNSQPLKQTSAGSTYSLNADGTGTMNFPAPASSDAGTLVLSGAKSVFVSRDGMLFIGGSTSGAPGMIVGMKTAAQSTTAMLKGIYFGDGLHTSAGLTFSFVGAANATGDGNIIWSRRQLQSGNSAPVNVSALNNYSIGANGSGMMLADSMAISADGNVFAASGMQPLIAGGNFELIFGVRAPSLSGSGLFLNPLGVFNAGSFAVEGPIAPGELITLFGTGFPNQTAGASKLPLPTTLGGVQVLVNGTAVPLVSTTATQLSAIVPYGVSGSTADIAVSAGGVKSNTVTVPLAATAPGVFTAISNGLGSAAVLHPDYSLVTQDKPARRGETIQIFLTGLGAVSPAIAAGTGAPANPLSVVSGPVGVFIDHVPAQIAYQGLTPGLASLYQLNVVVPISSGAGSLPLAVETADGFTDLATVPVR